MSTNEHRPGPGPIPWHEIDPWECSTKALPLPVLNRVANQSSQPLSETGDAPDDDAPDDDAPDDDDADLGELLSRVTREVCRAFWHYDAGAILQFGVEPSAYASARVTVMLTRPGGIEDWAADLADLEEVVLRATGYDCLDEVRAHVERDTTCLVFRTFD